MPVPPPPKFPKWRQESQAGERRQGWLDSSPYPPTAMHLPSQPPLLQPTFPTLPTSTPSRRPLGHSTSPPRASPPTTESDTATSGRYGQYNPLENQHSRPPHRLLLWLQANHDREATRLLHSSSLP